MQPQSNQRWEVIRKREKPRQWCAGCRAMHGASKCPKHRVKEVVFGKEFVLGFRKQFEETHGPQLWKVAL